MYYVIVFLALIVVMAVLIVLRTVANNPEHDEAELVKQDANSRAESCASPPPIGTPPELL
jgi:hypothetical protein